SFAFWNSFTACPIPRASSGSFFAPNKTRMMSRMTIKSGPAKFMKLARKLICCSRTSGGFEKLQGNLVFGSPPPRASQPGRKVDTPSLLCQRGARNPYAPHLERQHQLWAGLYPRGRLSGHTRGKDQLSAAAFERPQPNQIQKGCRGGLQGSSSRPNRKRLRVRARPVCGPARQGCRKGRAR